MYDEAKGMAELKNLSHDAKSHLQHVFRNHLQTIAGNAELLTKDENACLTAKARAYQIKEAIMEADIDLKRIGL